MPAPAIISIQRKLDEYRVVPSVAWLEVRFQLSPAQARERQEQLAYYTDDRIDAEQTRERMEAEFNA